MTESKKENRGGARAGCGRKPLADKKKAVTIFVAESKINKSGGLDILKQKLTKFIK